MLEAADLQKTYATGDEALKGVSISVEGSETVAMIGPSGAGKSTFIRCINRLTEPSGGEVALDGTELTELGDDGLRAARRDIGMIFQEYNLVERLTVMENVLTGRLGYVSTWRAFRRTFPPEDIERAYELLDRVGLGDMENKRVEELSGGQRQRVGIARAVIQEPKMLLVDEPTSSLDPETSNTVMGLLTEVAAEREIPVLINIHEVGLAVEHADRIVGLHDGEVVFEGTPEPDRAASLSPKDIQDPDRLARAYARELRNRPVAMTATFTGPRFLTGFDTRRSGFDAGSRHAGRMDRCTPGLVPPS